MGPSTLAMGNITLLPPSTSPSDWRSWVDLVWHVPCAQSWTLWSNIVPRWLKLRTKISDGAGVSCGIKRPALRHSVIHSDTLVATFFSLCWRIEITGIHMEVLEVNKGCMVALGALGGSWGFWPSHFPLGYGLQAYAFGPDIAAKNLICSKLRGVRGSV